MPENPTKSPNDFFSKIEFWLVRFAVFLIFLIGLYKVAADTLDKILHPGRLTSQVEEWYNRQNPTGANRQPSGVRKRRSRDNGVPASHPSEALSHRHESAASPPQHQCVSETPQ